MTPSKKFLEFNGRNIYFLSIQGSYWIAVKPICEALGVNYNAQYQNLKTDPLLNELYANQHMADKMGKLRSMVSLPEKFIYGWIFSIQSSSPELLKYKKECYDVLFDHFHGAVIERPQILLDRVRYDIQIDKLERKIKDNADFKLLAELKAKRKRASQMLFNLDKKIVISQMDIWKDDLPVATEEN